MAVDKRSSGWTLPLSQATTRIRGKFIIYQHRTQVVAAKWPRKRPEPPTPAQQEQRDEFKALVQATKNILPIEQVAAREVADGSYYTWRDVISLAMVGKLTELENYGRMVSQYNLDILGTEPGMIVIRRDEWVALAVQEDGKVLTLVDGLPDWAEPVGGIDALTGDVTAGPGVGTVPATLATTGVTPGAYTYAAIQVDAKGRVISASSGAYVPGMTQLTGDVTAGPGSGSQAATLANTAVVPGTYTLATVTVDAKGRITGAVNGSAGTPIDRNSPGLVTGRLYLPALAGTLTSATLLANILYAFPIYIPQNATLASLRFQVNGAGTATLAEVGMYSNTSGVPGSLLLDCGSIAVTGTGVKTFSSLTLPLTPNWYWIVLALNGSCTISCAPGTTGSSSVAQGTPTLTAATAAYVHAQGAWTFAAGALPSSFPSPTPNAGVYPAVAFTI